MMALQSMTPAAMARGGAAAVAAPGWSRAGRLLLVCPLAIGLGLGAAGCASFALMAAGLGATTRGAVEAIILAATAVVGTALAVRREARAVDIERPATAAMLVWAAVGAGVWASINYVQVARGVPHGGWDAWMTWNMRARFLHRAAADTWTDAFTPLLPWTHPDYPPLLPTLVARGWAYVGHESFVVPIAVGGIFALAALGVVSGGLGRLRGSCQASLAALVLLSVPFFLRHAAAQYADVPLAFFIAAALVLATLDACAARSGGRLMVLAGVAAGLAAWTKNEGAVVLAALLGARVVLAERWDWERCGRPALAFVVGAMPFLALLAYFKLQIAPPNEVLAAQVSKPRELWYYSSGDMAGQLRELLGRVLNVERQLAVARSVKKEVLEFGFNGLFGAAALLGTYLICLGAHVPRAQRRPVAIAALTLGFTLAGYWVALVTAPGDLPRMLNSSVDRLLLQLWPAAVFLFFLVAAPPDEAAATGKGATHEA